MSNIPRRAFVATGASFLGVSVAGCLDGQASASEEATFSTATTTLDPNCSCCQLHADYLESATIDVTIVERSPEELSELKDSLDIPPDLRSCHTTEIDGEYVIEGHVPIGVMNEVVESQPDVTVVGLPGMPSGSPGMPGSKEEEWVFYSIDEDGEVGEFARR